MSLKNPSVTITIPFYNSEATLLESIKSVFAQTYQNWELILLDDGSTDDSLNLAKRIKDPRVRVYSDGTNKGLVYRLNQIPQLASAEYLARLDADDMMHPQRIEKQLAFLISNPKVDIVDTGTYSIDETGAPVGIRGIEPIRYEAKYRLKKTMLLHASVMGKKQWFMNNKYDAAFLRAEDYELWCRTAHFSNFQRIEEPLYIVREGRVNIKNYVQSIKTIKKIFLIYGPEVLTREELKLEFAKIWLKVFAYKLFGMLNVQHVLSMKRNKQLSITERNELIAVLNHIDSLIII